MLIIIHVSQIENLVDSKLVVHRLAQLKDIQDYLFIFGPSSSDISYNDVKSLQN